MKKLTAALALVVASLLQWNVIPASAHTSRYCGHDSVSESMGSGAGALVVFARHYTQNVGGQQIHRHVTRHLHHDAYGNTWEHTQTRTCGVW